ncbi:hypothetical protein MATL_G00234220 [Megalops atlanticus]|uniref:Uncharacterized protein n=1 Tax=Megalops atlanticus TaxID=7932 RepID=A0A9D3SYB1_MEGAT|nr:hypothetical protein MATL_G00234220 [Megalops atlanticus]
MELSKFYTARDTTVLTQDTQSVDDSPVSSCSILEETINDGDGPDASLVAAATSTPERTSTPLNSLNRGESHQIPQRTRTGIVSVGSVTLPWTFLSA